MGQGVDDRDVSVDLDGLAMECGRAVAPLADSREGGLDKERIAGENFERLDGAIGGNDGAEFDAAFAASLDGEGRIDWLNAIEELGFLDDSAQSDHTRLRSACLFGRLRSAGRFGKGNAETGTIPDGVT